MRQTRKSRSHPLKTFIYVDRGDHIESTLFDKYNLYANAHSVIGQSLYIFNSSVSHCDRRVGCTAVKITDSVWSVEEQYWDKDMKFASRVMGDHCS
jgi:hypothetical protein